MILDAVVLAGGRSSRLGGTVKSGLLLDGRTLLARTVAAASAARRVVVVGDVVVPGTLHAREFPAFGGPAAGLAAGLDALGRDDPADRVLLLACDMPGVAVAVRALLTAPDQGRDGTIAVDASGRPQYLAGLYTVTALDGAIARNRHRLTNLSMRGLLEGLNVREMPIPGESTADIDTWADAARFGIEQSKGTP